jgi:hypothetical protein
MLAAVIEAPGAVAGALAASGHPEHLKIALDVAGQDA